MLPTAVFLDNILPKFDTKSDDGDAETRSAMVPVFGPTVQKWFEFMTSQDPVGVRVASEVRSGLEKWGADGRWDSIVGAGVRDHAPGTVFDGILAKTIPSEVVFEDDVCLAFRDVNPVGPVHVLVIPKQREGLTHLRFAQEDHKSTLGHLLWAAAKIARNEGLNEGYRVVINDGGAAAQSVFHLHVHVIGGRQMEWPPG
jgi:histidine triad (HIT) family protein